MTACHPIISRSGSLTSQSELCLFQKIIYESHHVRICFQGSGLGGIVVSILGLQAEGRRFESRLGRDIFQTISTPSSYSACPGLSIKWTGWRMVANSGIKCAWVIHETSLYKRMACT